MRRQGLFQPGGLSLCRPGGACRTAVPAVYSPRRTRTRVLFYLHGSNPAYPLVHPFRRPTEACFDMVRKATNAPGGEPRAPGEDTDWPGWRLKLVRGECKVGRMSSTPVMGGTWLQETYYSRGFAEGHRDTGLLSIAEDQEGIQQKCCTVSQHYHVCIRCIRCPSSHSLPFV